MFEARYKLIVGQYAKEAMELTSSTLTTRKLNGMHSLYKASQAKKKKVAAGDASKKSRGGSAAATSKRGRSANTEEDNTSGGGKRRRTASSAAEKKNGIFDESGNGKGGGAEEDDLSLPDMTKEDYVWCQTILITLTEHPLSLPFLDPVDDTITSYHSVITHAMDFSTMEANLNEKNREDYMEEQETKKMAAVACNETGGSGGSGKGKKKKTPPKKKKSKKKIKIDHTNCYYRTKALFLKDVRLIFSNCRKFNANGSELHGDAEELERSLDSSLGIDKSRRRYAANRMSDDASKWCGKVLHQIRCHKDAFPFQMPVDKSFKDYHRKIKKPIDFMTLGRRLHDGMYPDRIAFCDQMKLIFENCMTYNPNGSDLVTMAKRLEKYFQSIVPESILAEEAERIKKEEEEEENRRNA